MKPAHKFSLCPGGCQGTNHNNNHNRLEIGGRTIEKEKTIRNNIKKHNKTRNPSITQRLVKHDEKKEDGNKNYKNKDNKAEFGFMRGESWLPEGACKQLVGKSRPSSMQGRINPRSLGVSSFPGDGDASKFRPFLGNDCCNCLCNKRGLFTEIDMAFSNFMQLVPNSNTACRCCNKLYTAPIFQGRSCACLIRPRQRPYGGCGNGSSGGRGCSPERCGCYNHIYEDIYL